MRTFDDEKFVLDHYRSMLFPKRKYIGRFLNCLRIEKLTKSILFKLSWKNSSSSDALPPDFHNNRHHIMMDVMRVDDCINKVSGKHVANSYERMDKYLKKTFGKKYKEIDATVYFNADTTNPKEFNFEGYLKNFERVVINHSNKVENYHQNYPKCKNTVFFIFDESNNYVQVTNKEELKQANNKYLHLHNVFVHNCYIDKRFLEVIKNCQADYVIWMGLYKTMLTDTRKSKMPHYVIYDVKHIRQEGHEYNYDLMLKI